MAGKGKGEGEDRTSEPIEKADDLYSAAVATIAAVFGGEDHANAVAPGWLAAARRDVNGIRVDCAPTDDEEGRKQVQRMAMNRGIDQKTRPVTIPMWAAVNLLTIAEPADGGDFDAVSTHKALRNAVERARESE